MIVIYSSPSCPKCKLLAAHLTSIKQPFQEANLIDLLEDAATMTDLHLQGISFKAAPVLQIESAYYGPERFFVGGKLDEKKLQELIS